MAKKSSDVNKSEKIREYYRTHRRVKPADVVAALAAEGIAVSPQVVSSVRFTMKKKKKRGAGLAAAPALRRKVRRKKVATGGLEHLIEAKKLADKVGGIPQARHYLDMLEQLQ